MYLAQALQKITTISISPGSTQVIETILEELKIFGLPQPVTIKTSSEWVEKEKSFRIGIVSRESMRKITGKPELDVDKNWVSFSVDENGSGWLLSTQPYYLYSFARYVMDVLGRKMMSALSLPVVVSPSFHWQRVSYDYFLTQEGRSQKGLNRETYVRELARTGFTHLEVNGLGYPMALENGPKGETYPMFYTYCPALDQFVTSRLNKGLYPTYYLSANLEYLKQNAALARKYGLVPGMLCFEPRSVPEEFFQKYPMLRGARIDHPFRSFQPRYNMTITHPVVLDHYAEMLQNLMREVPDLGYINIWTNDSGAGFEHTKSLYVGRNGGPYLIREWKDDSEIARLAGNNALRFLRTLRDAGQEINPDFRVITRMESFYGEHDTVWNGLRDKLEVETSGLAIKGWKEPAHHPRYKDVTAINPGTVYQQKYQETETALKKELEERDSQAHYYFTVGPHWMFEPLLGVPYPKLTHLKLKQMTKAEFYHLAHSGGTTPPELVPFNINHEIVRQYLYDAEMNIDSAVHDYAMSVAGNQYAGKLLQAWDLAEEAIISFPNVTSLYSAFGFTWYRLWSRPFVPDIEALSEQERAWYQDHMCTTPHNPNNVDLSRDVLFQLVKPSNCARIIERIDQNSLPPLDEAIKILSVADGQSETLPALYDQWIRLRALRSWITTQRNVAAWIDGVYGFENADSEAEKNLHKESVQLMMKIELQNTDELADLLSSGVEFMAMTDSGETPLVYGTNLRDNLRKRKQLMEDHFDDDPYIDHDYIMKQAGKPVV